MDVYPVSQLLFEVESGVNITVLMRLIEYQSKRRKASTEFTVT